VGDSDASGSGQSFRAFPAFSLSIVVLPLAADFCDGSRVDEPACRARNSTDHGQTQAWKPDQSQSWKAAGEVDVFAALGLWRSSDENHTATMQSFGTDNVGLDESSTNSIILANQSIAAVISKTFPMALFGLSNRNFILGGLNTSTFLSNLAEAFVDPDNSSLSTSVSYTAGCYSRGWPVSLVLGGYDSMRFDPSTTLEVDLRDVSAASDSHQVTVNITSIEIGVGNVTGSDVDAQSLKNISVPIDSGMTVSIDPITPQIWLPKTACEAFEIAFSLEWDDASRLYLVNESTHRTLLQRNQSVAFSLSSSRFKGTTRTFTLFYSTAFDMNVTYPMVDSSRYYFPLKRALNSDQYILGRAFLQETHISIDYDSGYFNLSRATQGSDQPSLVAIQRRIIDAKTKSSKLSMAAYAGIGVGAGVLALVVGLLFLFKIKMWWPFQNMDSPQAFESYGGKAELHNDAVPWVEAMERERMELETNEPALEVATPDSHQHGAPGLNDLYELEIVGVYA
jgi:hypothetical protein